MTHLKVALVFPFYTDAVRLPQDVLAAYPIVRCLPPAIAELGADARVFLQSPSDAHHVHQGVRYEFVAASGPVRLVARAAYRWKRNLGPAYYEPVFGLTRALDHFAPDVVHFFGLTMDIQLGQIARYCLRRAIPLIVHFHGGQPATGRRGHLQRHNLARVSRVLFTTREQADDWISAGTLPGWDRVEIVLETSSPFERLPRPEARLRTGMTGDPVCLSVGRLHAIKDPMTMLRGFARFAQHAPAARLYLYYLTDELISEVRQFIDMNPGLAERVELRGRASRSEMAAIYSSADVLLQASQREWSGLAILEAMSCGCIPVVSDIPSFRAMTGDGRFGRLFPPGDAEALASALRDLTAGDTNLLSTEVEAHFRRAMSFDALAHQLVTLYHAVAAQRAATDRKKYN